MTDHPIDLDRHRGMAAQKSTEIRRRLQEVQADQVLIRARRDDFEKFLLAAPATSLAEVAAKARYLLELYRGTHDASDERRQKLIAIVSEELRALED